MQMPGLPSAFRRALGRGRWPGWLAPASAQAVTAVMVGSPCLAARVEMAAGKTRPQLVDAVEGSTADLARWRSGGLFKASRALLVLRSAERHVLTLDRPEVPDHELALAVRWPLGETLEVEPDQLLTTAVEMPRINESVKPQVLAIAAHLQPVRDQLATLQAAGIAVRSIDVIDSALRGMRLLQPADNDGWVALAMIGQDLCIGLLWHGRFCALRSLALPVRQPRSPQEFEEQLALHIQRTTDLFERQARQLAIRQVLAALPSLSPEARESVRTALPLPARLFEPDQAFEASALVIERCAGQNDLVALACVAAARLIDLQTAGGEHADAAAGLPS